jgi:membrane-associated phospholipid phosphatase
LGWFCPTDFGNPSGHSFIFVALYEPLFTDFIGAGTKKIAIIVWVIIVPLLMISRMYLGDHSLDQIIFGALLGITFLVIYRFKLQYILYNLLATLIKQEHKIFYFVANTIALIIAILVPLINY